MIYNYSTFLFLIFLPQIFVYCYIDFFINGLHGKSPSITTDHNTAQNKWKLIDSVMRIELPRATL